MKTRSQYKSLEESHLSIAAEKKNLDNAFKGDGPAFCTRSKSAFKARKALGDLTNQDSHSKDIGKTKKISIRKRIRSRKNVQKTELLALPPDHEENAESLDVCKENQYSRRMSGELKRFASSSDSWTGADKSQPRQTSKKRRFSSLNGTKNSAKKRNCSGIAGRRPENNNKHKKNIVIHNVARDQVQPRIEDTWFLEWDRPGKRTTRNSSKTFAIEKDKKSIGKNQASFSTSQIGTGGGNSFPKVTGNPDTTTAKEKNGSESYSASKKSIIEKKHSVPPLYVEEKNITSTTITKVIFPPPSSSSPPPPASPPPTVTTTNTTDNTTFSCSSMTPSLDTPAAIKPVDPRIPPSVPAFTDMDLRYQELFGVDFSKEMYKYLLDIQSKFRPMKRYMQYQRQIDGSMRAVLVDWLVEVAEEYELHMETLFLAVNLIDRFLSRRIVVRGKLQLVGIAAMLLATKYEEIRPPAVDEFVHISDRAYRREDILEWEKGILDVLSYRLAVPTSKHFLDRLLDTSAQSPDVCLRASFLCELCLLDVVFLDFEPSVVAGACIFLSLTSFKKVPWNRCLEHYSGYSIFYHTFQDCVMELYTLIQKIPYTNLKAIPEKYSRRINTNPDVFPPPDFCKNPEEYLRSIGYIHQSI